jgi:hypothetical protein
MTKRGTEYKIISLDLGVARDSQKISMEGNLLRVIEATDSTCNIYVELDSPSNDLIKMVLGNSLTSEFEMIFITNAIQAAKTLKILICKKEDLDFSSV